MMRQTKRICRAGRRSTRRRPCVPGIGKLRKGDLTQFGYEDVDQLSASKRHAALKKAVAAFGALSVFRKLNAIYIYTRKSSPTSSHIFNVDRDWVRETYMH